MARRSIHRAIDAARIHDPAERELVEGRYGDWKADLYAATGGGAATASLPEATVKELYGEFEHDQQRPPDGAP